MTTRPKPNVIAVAAALVVPAAAAWAILIYVCHIIVAGAAIVIDLIAGSL